MIYFRNVKMRQNLLQRPRIRNLIHITENDNIVRFASSHAADQLILLKLVPLMSRHAAHGRIVHRHIDDLIRKFPEHLPVLRKDHLLRLPGKSHRRLLQHKLIHIRRHDLHSQLQNIQFIKKRDAIVNHFYLHLRQNRNGLTVSFTFCHLTFQGFSNFGYCAFRPRHL